MELSDKDPRRSQRAKVFLAASIDCAGKTLPVVLRDLSEHGALIESEGGLEVDAEVLFRRNELSVPGYVAWMDGNQAGIAFARPLKAEVVLRHINRPQPRSADEELYRRPALTPPGMSAEEQRWAEELMRDPVRRRDRK